ncbi:MAG: hypothetical protein R3336_03435 [Phycisphaeraceae bacterium]|nr:hypothetical protein [Phycisphaeraceae bacterium]
MDDHLQPSAWGDASGPSPYRRAALLCWLTGAMEILIFGCCAGVFAMFGQFSAEQFPPEQHEQFKLIQQIAPLVAVAVVVMGVLPGLIYVGLGFAVKAQKTWAVVTGLIFAIGQAFMLGLMLLYSLVNAVMMMDPVSFTLNVIVIGSPLALLVFLAYWLMKAFSGPSAQPQANPWDPPA